MLSVLCPDCLIDGLESDALRVSVASSQELRATLQHSRSQQECFPQIDSVELLPRAGWRLSRKPVRFSSGSTVPAPGCDRRASGWRGRWRGVGGGSRDGWAGCEEIAHLHARCSRLHLLEFAYPGASHLGICGARLVRSTVPVDGLSSSSNERLLLPGAVAVAHLDIGLQFGGEPGLLCQMQSGYHVRRVQQGDSLVLGDSLIQDSLLRCLREVLARLRSAVSERFQVICEIVPSHDSPGSHALPQGSPSIDCGARCALNWSHSDVNLRGAFCSVCKPLNERRHVIRAGRIPHDRHVQCRPSLLVHFPRNPTGGDALTATGQ